MLRNLRFLRPLATLLGACFLLSFGAHWLPVDNELRDKIAAPATAILGWAQQILESDSPVAAAHPLDVAATAASVIDGDTISAATPLGEQRVRVLSIDTPEATTKTECGGVGATEFARQLIPVGTPITLTPDSTQADTDKYGRVLRHITLPDGRDYATQSAQEGWVKKPLWYGAAPRNSRAIEQGIATAREQGRGLWAACPGMYEPEQT